MSVEGVWKVEVIGPYGWEKMATASVRDGHYFGASVDHYSTGSYEVDGDALTVNLQVVQHGKVRAVYGSKKRKMSIQLKLKIKKENKMVGESYLTTGKKHTLKTRLIRLGDFV